uniref:Uncharacterized protein n=1 Tax=Panagrolaimus sp. JU765 TaxID=591449 RepID=A0AC34RQD7_9BILA
MGYPNDTDHSVATVIKGHINGLPVNQFLSGTPGVQRGFLGGPVFDWKMWLSGILIGPVNEVSTSSSVSECSASSKEQERILLFSYILGKIDVSP